MPRREIFGPERFGAHLIVGMGESDHDVLTQVQKIRDLGGHSHMFAFFPETRLADGPSAAGAARRNGGASSSRAISSTIATSPRADAVRRATARLSISACRRTRSMQ